jgi:predicted CDP-diglyceride synthetase/phosphatidate cytidylyltransferase
MSEFNCWRFIWNVPLGYARMLGINHYKLFLPNISLYVLCTVALLSTQKSDTEGGILKESILMF